MPQGIGGADAISAVKIEKQRPVKSRNVILKLAPPKDQTRTGKLNYFLAVGREERRAECAPHLSVEQMAPHNSHGPWPGGMGRGQLQGSLQAWLQLVEFGVSVPLEVNHSDSRLKRSAFKMYCAGNSLHLLQKSKCQWFGENGLLGSGAFLES